MAVAAGLSEAAEGTLLALGFATPLAGALLATVMINAIGSVTFKKAFMLGSELEIAYLTIAVSLAAVGPGRFSIDRAIGWDDNISGVWWGVAALDGARRLVPDADAGAHPVRGPGESAGTTRTGGLKPVNTGGEQVGS